MVKGYPLYASIFIYLRRGLILAVIITEILCRESILSASEIAPPYRDVTNPPEPGAYLFFGRAVAIDADTAVVGANGWAYVFVRRSDDWVFQQKLIPDDSGILPPLAMLPPFGAAVAVNGNVIVVAAANWDREPGKTGAVFVFERVGEGWVRQAVITSPDPRPFGFSVALRNGTLLVGAMEDRLEFGGTSDAGIGYVFIRSGNAWTQQAKLMRADLASYSNEQSGLSAALDGDTAVIGAGAGPFLPFGPNRVDVFSRSGGAWSHEAKIESPTNSSGFGSAVSLDRGTIMVGDSARGEILFYNRQPDGWTAVYTFGDGPPNDNGLGRAVALRNGRMLYSEPSQTILACPRYQCPRAGIAWLSVVDTTAWTFEPSDLLMENYYTNHAGRDLFGFSVALSDTSAIVGAPGRSSAFIYNLAPVVTLEVPSNLTFEATSPAGAVATYDASATDIAGNEVPVAFSIPPGTTFPFGRTTVTATATDRAGRTATGSFTVTVRDTTPPVIQSLSASPKMLWPANHRLVAVTLSAAVSDAADANPSQRIVSVTSSEAVDPSHPDWIVTGDMSLQLRAERNGSGSGRLYTIVIEAADAAGNATRATATVATPKAQDRVNY